MAGRRRTRRLPTTGDLFGIKVAAAPAEADYNLDAIAGRPTHAPLKGSRAHLGNGQALDRRWTIIGLFLGCAPWLSYWA